MGTFNPYPMYGPVLGYFGMQFISHVDRNAFQRKSFRQTEFSSEAWLELTTIEQLTQLKVLRVGDILVRCQEEYDVALFVFDRHDIEQTVERTSCN